MKAGQPGEPFLGSGDIFVLKTVRPRNQKTRETTFSEFGSQGGDAFCACRSVGLIFECLEVGLKHVRHLYGAKPKRAMRRALFADRRLSARVPDASAPASPSPPPVAAAPARALALDRWRAPPFPATS